MADFIMRDQAEIDDVLNKCFEHINQGTTKFRGMTYEQGVDEMYQWLTGQSDDNPMDD